MTKVIRGTAIGNKFRLRSHQPLTIKIVRVEGTISSFDCTDLLKLSCLQSFALQRLAFVENEVI